MAIIFATSLLIYMCLSGILHEQVSQQEPSCGTCPASSASRDTNQDLVPESTNEGQKEAEGTSVYALQSSNSRRRYSNKTHRICSRPKCVSVGFSSAITCRDGVESTSSHDNNNDSGRRYSSTATPKVVCWELHIHRFHFLARRVMLIGEIINRLITVLLFDSVFDLQLPDNIFEFYMWFFVLLCPSTPQFFLYFLYKW